MPDEGSVSEAPALGPPELIHIGGCRKIGLTDYQGPMRGFCLRGFPDSRTSGSILIYRTWIVVSMDFGLLYSNRSVCKDGLAGRHRCSAGLLYVPQLISPVSMKGTSSR